MRAVLLSTREDIREMLELLRTLDFTLDNVIIQKRDFSDTRTYFGKGKIAEVKGYLQGAEADIIVVNDETKPVQRLNLENELGLEVYDRMRIILEIFKQRAWSEEAKLQVELAALEYEGPWLKELIHRSRHGEHPGLMAGGEYQVRQYFTQNTRRERVIKKRLRAIEKDRGRRRGHRHREGFVLVAITGYTNAGKSTLFNALTEEEVLVDDRMFATLSTTTRRLGDQQPKVLLTDTVGFIENLPPWLVKAFNSTMEEVFESDMVVLVVDGTDDGVEMLRKGEASLDVVQSGSTGPQKVVIVMNKSDLLSSQEVRERSNALQRMFASKPVYIISAKDGGGLTELTEVLNRAQEEITKTVAVELRVPDDDFTPPFINWLYENTVVKERGEEDGDLFFKAVVPQRLVKELRQRCKKAGCSVEEEEGVLQN